MDYYMASQMTTAIIDVYISSIKVAVGVGLLLSLLSIIGYWKVYKKAGQPGWGSIVPFYNTYLLYKITWGCGWIFLAPLVFSIVGAFFVDGIISSLLVIASVVLSCMTYYKTGTAFGKGVGFGIGLILLNWLFILILGFSDAQYQGVLLKGGKARRDSDENEVTTQ